ncbi:unnamed protein product [Candidula unifasciata]|uniref:Uncharacterized protein n=1 Tax=Candidula unifasciata TaxID=100452 RepID=A0A8S3YY98_9EUPU|nr:unnamed protein product [Candidula unifasciata]
MLLFLMTSFQDSTPQHLFYKFFHDDEPSDSQEVEDSQQKAEAPPLDPVEYRKARKRKLQRVVERLHSMYLFYAATNAKTTEAEMQLLNSDAIVPEFETGHFRLIKGDPFPQDMRVIWISVNGVGVAFVCYDYDNRVQGEITLRVLVRKLHECRFILQPSEIFNRPEKIDILLNKFVPCGHTLFMNHRVIKQLEKECDVLFKAIGN